MARTRRAAPLYQAHLQHESQLFQSGDLGAAGHVGPLAGGQHIRSLLLLRGRALRRLGATSRGADPDVGGGGGHSG